MQSNRLKKFLKYKILLGVLFLALLLRFIGLMPNITNVDEAFIEIKSWGLVNSIFTSGDINPHTFKYGSLMFYSQALTALPVLGASYSLNAANTLISSSFTAKALAFSNFYDESIPYHSDTLVMLGRAQTAIFGVLSVFVVYLIAKKLFSPRIGILSALFLAIAPLHVRDSHYITSDILALLTALVAILFLVYMIETKKWKWFVLSGIALGISCTVRYFPIAIMAYPIALLMSFTKDKQWFVKVIVSVVCVGVGVFIGLPFLFLDPQGPVLLMQDLEKYALPWYGTSISKYLFALVTYLMDGAAGPLPSTRRLFDTGQKIKYIHSSWIFFNSFGIFPALVSLMGIVVALRHSLKKFLFIFIIPFLTLIYITVFIPASYERLVIPILPFLAIFAGIGVDFIFKKSKFAPVLLIVALFLPLMKSFSSSLACGQENIQRQSLKWINKNIPTDAKIGYLTMVTLPPKDYAAWTQLEPEKKLSLEEAKELGLTYAFINASRLDYNTYNYFNDFFITPPELFENSYYSLVLAEYHSRAEFLGKVRKPWMCDAARIYYYKLPAQLTEGKNSIESIDFSSKESSFSDWSLKSPDKTGTASFALDETEGHSQKGSLAFKQSIYSYTPPRLASSQRQVRPEKSYTFSFWAKTTVPVTSIIARMDFYTSGGIPIVEKLKEMTLLLDEGSVPVYFEKKREKVKSSTTDLPGSTVAISPMSYLTDKWQKIVVTARAPEEPSFVTLSIQSTTSPATTIYIDDLQFLEE